MSHPSVVPHQPTHVITLGSGWRIECICGWEKQHADRTALKEAVAQHVRDATVRDRGGVGGRCAKVDFHSQQEALAFLAEAKVARYLHNRRVRREERAYWCRRCAAWHVTSQPPRRRPPSLPRRQPFPDELRPRPQ